MKNFRTRISVTKLVFLVVMICLCIFTGYQYYKGYEMQNKLRESVVTSIVAFYFWQKVGEAKKDPLIDNEKENGSIL